MKKWLAILLCMIMIVSLIPAAPVHADLPDGYYLVGNMTNWQAREEYKLSGPDANGVYSLNGVELTYNSAMKVVPVSGGETLWASAYPSGGESTNYMPRFSGTAGIVFKDNTNNDGFLRIDIEEGYYLVGNMTNWQIQPANKFTSLFSGPNIYYMDTQLTTHVDGQDDGIKVVTISNGYVTWPDGENCKPGIDGDARVYFRPNSDGTGWHNGYIRAVPIADAANDGYYFVGNVESYQGTDRNWKMWPGFKLSADNGYTVRADIYWNASDGTALEYKAALYLGGQFEIWYPAGEGNNKTLTLYDYDHGGDEMQCSYKITMDPADPAGSISIVNTPKVFVRAENEAPEHGTVSVNGVSYATASSNNNVYLTAYEGDTLTIVPTPDQGYVLSLLSGYIWSPSFALTNANLSANPITLTVPTNISDHAFDIHAEFEAAPAASYAVTTSAVNGTVSVSATTLNSGEIEEGDTVTVSAEANPGYQLDTITVTNNATSAAVAMSGNTFVMPGAAVTVTATFTETDHYYLVTAGDDTLYPEKQFSLNTVDPAMAPYRLNGQRLLAGTMIQVVKAEGGVITARYPGAGQYYEVEGKYASDNDINYSNINIRFDPAGNHPDHANTDPLDDPFLRWSDFPGAYFCWEPYSTVIVFPGATHAVTVNDTFGAITFATQSGLVYSAHAGETVTLTVTPNDGYTFASWDVKDASDNPVAVTNDTFTMPDSAVTISANYTSNDTPILKSVYLTVDGKIGVTFKLILPAGLEASSVTAELTVGGTTTSTLLSTLTPTDGVYSISTWLPARQMDTQITIRTKVGDTYKMQSMEGSPLTEGYNTSISACCDAYASSGNQTLAALATAMKTYGAYAHAYLDNVALSNPPALNVADNVFNNLEITMPASLPEGLTLKSMFLTLKDDTAINLRFTIADGHSFEKYASIDGLFMNGSTVLNPVQDGNTLVITISGIAAARLDNDCTVTVKLQGNETSTITCSALYYGKLAMNTDKDALKNAVKALYAYNVAADAYFGA